MADTRQSALLASLSFLIAGILKDQAAMDKINQLQNERAIVYRALLTTRLEAGIAGVAEVQTQLGIPKDQQIEIGVHLTDYGLTLASWAACLEKLDSIS
jgi:hypothetical protein